MSLMLCLEGGTGAVSCQSAEPGSGQIFILPLHQHSIEPVAGFEPGSMPTKGLC